MDVVKPVIGLVVVASVIGVSVYAYKYYQAKKLAEGVQNLNSQASEAAAAGRADPATTSFVQRHTGEAASHPLLGREFQVRNQNRDTVNPLTDLGGAGERVNV